MSWDKNTINVSSIDAIKNVLDDLSYSYTLTILGKVIGCGLNDKSDGTHEIRKLEYADFVVVEQMQRSKDCDVDDVIVSYKFTKDTLPKRWKVEKYID